MPCDSDYMNATEFEKNLSVVYGLLDEIKTGYLSENFGDGYDERVYNKGFSKNHLDEKTAELCSKLQKLDVTKYSLEMQMWWRDHQRADKKRIQEILKHKKEQKDREIAISKLSDYEKKLLGIK